MQLSRRHTPPQRLPRPALTHSMLAGVLCACKMSDMEHQALLAMQRSVLWGRSGLRRHKQAPDSDKASTPKLEQWNPGKAALHRLANQAAIAIKLSAKPAEPPAAAQARGSTFVTCCHSFR